MKVRARNLDDDDVADIVAILDGWSGTLSWERLVEAVEARKFARYTRQALHKHERIARAFAARKAALAEAGPALEVESPELKVALERVARLESENSRLRAENALLVEQFVRWAYNAHARGLSKEFLNRPLPTASTGSGAEGRTLSGQATALVARSKKRNVDAPTATLVAVDSIWKLSNLQKSMSLNEAQSAREAAEAPDNRCKQPLRWAEACLQSSRATRRNSRNTAKALFTPEKFVHNRSRPNRLLHVARPDAINGAP